MQHITYMGGTIRLRGKFAASRGTLILVPYPPNTMRMTRIPIAHITIKFLTHLKDNQSPSNRPTGDYLKDQTVTEKKKINYATSTHRQEQQNARCSNSTHLHTVMFTEHAQLSNKSTATQDSGVPWDSNKGLNLLRPNHSLLACLLAVHE